MPNPAPPPPLLSRPIVLQVLPALEAGGVEQGAIEIAQAIVAAGGQAIVASAGGRLVPRIARVGAIHVTLPLDSKNPWSMWRNADRLAALIRTHRIDLVHARSRAPAWSAWLAARRTFTPFVTTWHGAYSENLPGKRRYNDVMARGARVIAISHHIAAQLMARHGVPPERVRIIPRGVDPAVFDAEAIGGDRLLRLARQWRLLDGQRVVLLAGRLTRWKGQSVAIEALARLAATDAYLVLAGAEQGRSAYVRELLRLAVRLDVSERVRLVGDCADMPAALKLAEVALNCSTTPEAFGRTVIEAQAVGRVVIAADHGGAAETVAHGQTGLLVPPNDAAALAAMLDAALAMPAAARAAMAQAARASVLAHYTTASMQQTTLAVYNEVLGG